ncbi:MULTISPECIES: excalibur calcium-binding domain-containing protein [unclassified Pseudoxanthomonas]|uniref:excalibur calcium-binding domain-containing protein n=1 Tax=unclassified Pseudoxanthomonas TaxID=2645906 RepID=UPI00307808C9
MGYMLIFGVLLLVATPTAWAHGGGLNKDGCHNNRRTGDYHCHRGSGNSAPSPPLYAPRNETPPAFYTPPRSPSGARPFANCAEARAAGAAPVRRGEPGYGSHLDRDNDGVGCEPYRGK